MQAPKLSPEGISDQATALQEMLPIRARWEPVDKLLALEGVPLLIRIIAYSYEWSYSGRQFIFYVKIIFKMRACITNELK